MGRKQKIFITGGEKFGMLTIIEETHPEIQYNRFKPTKLRKVLCKCECGKKVNIRLTSLVTGYVKSCGCLTARVAREKSNRLTHGMTRSTEYTSWLSMRVRCYDKTNKSYHNYGGRGITVCERWMNSFENFFLDMGKKPSKTHSLDRINNNGNYEPSNCKWSTPSEQAKNRRKKNVVI